MSGIKGCYLKDQLMAAEFNWMLASADRYNYTSRYNR